MNQTRVSARRAQPAAALLLRAGPALLLLASGWWAVSRWSSPAEDRATAPAVESAESHPLLGSGFAVWESNRSGHWRLWRRDLDGSGLARLTSDSIVGSHCCPHISPDGHRVAYLNLEGEQTRYPEGNQYGQLRLVNADGSNDRRLLPRVRTYFENRAAVWLSDDTLAYIDADGRTQSLDLSTGRRRRLTRVAVEKGGWLCDPTLSWATTGEPTFSPFDAARGVVARRGHQGGCQPWFSQDGRWGYWVAGAGGPLRRMELASRRSEILLRKNDPRIPDGFGYVYFPMLSRTGQSLAFAASRGDHDHFSSDYEVFVAPTDPETLELLGPALRLSFNGSTDRYPDVHDEPMELGRHFGEAPYTPPLDAGEGPGPWSWSLGDGSEAQGTSVRHTYRAPGSYRIVADDGRTLRRGLVIVRPAQPPRAVSLDVRDGRQLLVQFDEPVHFPALEARLESGHEVGAWRAGDDGRSLLLELVREPREGDRLRLAGVVDRAQEPNALRPVHLVIPASTWPSKRAGLVFLWQTAMSPNLVPDPAGGAARSWELEASGRARLDRHHAMRLDGGRFVAPGDAAASIVNAAKHTNTLSFELTLTPSREQRPGGTLLALAGRPTRARSRFLLLEQLGSELWLELHSKAGKARPIRLRLARLTAARPTHLVVSYEPGRLLVVLDGQVVLDTDAHQRDFFHWKPRPLVFGNAWEAERPWHGSLEGIAFYNRFLPPEEASENARRYARLRQARPDVRLLELRAELLRLSEVPTLESISPYRDALVVAEYRMLDRPAGAPPGERVRVAHFAWLNGEAQPLPRSGQTRTLVLQPYAENPQLASLFLSDTLDDEPSLRLYYDGGR